MKRIVICMDGTWQTLNQDELTNIGIIARSVAHKETRPDGSHIQQTVIYSHGVGSSLSALADPSFSERAAERFNRLAGGAFGSGLENLLLDTYLRLAFNYEAGDELYIFGFSRGAFAARRLAGLINTAGIVSRVHAEKARDGFRLYYNKPRDSASDAVKQEHEDAARQFRMLYGKGARNADGTRRQTEDVPPITYIGVFDTVVQRGLGGVIASFTPWDDQRNNFANLRVCPNTRAARHAVALDEARIGFPPMLWNALDESNREAGAVRFEQRWFVGTHGDIGGGLGSKLAAAALKWVAEGAAAQGLRFYATYGEDRSPLDQTLHEAGMSWDSAISRPPFWKALQPIHYPWRARKIWSAKERPTLDDAQATFDEGVIRRSRADYVRPRYRPASLRPFSKALKDWQLPGG
ncbi:MAG: DUF2235 domain-containing protein [Hyphomonadaceae bacterium]